MSESGREFLLTWSVWAGVVSQNVSTMEAQTSPDNGAGLFLWIGLMPI